MAATGSSARLVGAQPACGSALLGDDIAPAYALVRRFVTRRAPDPATADDVTQDVFLAFASTRPRFATEKHALAWLFVVARNRLADEYRRRERERSSEFGAACRAHWTVDTAEDGVALRNALCGLSRSERRIVGLHLLLGLSFVDISAVIHSNEPATRQRFNRGIKHLRALLAAEIMINER